MVMMLQMILQALRSWPPDIAQFILSKAMLKVLRSWPADITQFILSKAMMKVPSRFVLTLVVAPDLVDSMEDVYAHGCKRLGLRTSP